MIPVQAKIAGIAGLFAAGLWLGYEWRDRACDAAAQKVRADAEQALKDFSEQARKRERDLTVQVNAIEIIRRQEQEHAQQTIERLTADIRSGERRLRDRFTCPDVPGATAGTAGGDEGTQGGLRRADAEFLVRLAADADGVVRQLTSCQDILRAERNE